MTAMVGSSATHPNELFVFDGKNATKVTTSNPWLADRKLGKQEVITYKAKDEKHSVYVFTDITCGYCKKLHDQMGGYNELGITVNYIAYPRNGIGTTASKKMETVWCEDDKKVAKRSNGRIYDKFMHPLNLEDLNSIRNSFFQYMIGNTDFSTAYSHNEIETARWSNATPWPWLHPPSAGPDQNPIFCG